MEIITNGHSFKDAVRQIVQLFFDINSDISVESSLKEEDSTLIAHTKIIYDGKEAVGDICEKFSIIDRRTASDTVKKSVLTACKKLSDMPTPWGISTGIRPAKAARQMLDEGIDESAVFNNLQNELWITPQKAKLSLDVAKKEKQILDLRPKNTVSIYVGIPFCPTRCAYCSFISQAIKYNEKFVAPYIKALCLEIEHTAKICEKLGKRVETIYFGGGTPTSISPELLKTLIDKVKGCFDISALREFTVEAGRPDTFSTEMLSMLSEAGIDRISINPQTMNDKTLKLIGRNHTADDTRRAFEMAKKYNFSINADLIAGLPEETLEDFKYTTKELLKLSPDAVTVHTMYIKRASRLIDDFQKYRFVTEAANMVEYAKDVLSENGFSPYYLYKQKNTLGNLENTAYAKEGHECLYNIYIMEEVQSVFALGGGASTKIVKNGEISRIYNPKDAADYIKRIDEILEKKYSLLD